MSTYEENNELGIELEEDTDRTGLEGYEVHEEFSDRDGDDNENCQQSATNILGY